LAWEGFSQRYSRMVITSDRVDALQDAQSEGFDQPLSVWMYSNLCGHHKTMWERACSRRRWISQLICD